MNILVPRTFIIYNSWVFFFPVVQPFNERGTSCMLSSQTYVAGHTMMRELFCSVERLFESESHIDFFPMMQPHSTAKRHSVETWQRPPLLELQLASHVPEASVWALGEAARIHRIKVCRAVNAWKEENHSSQA